MSRIEDSTFAEIRWDTPDGMLETPESLSRRIALTVTLDMEMHAVINGEVVELERFCYTTKHCGCHCHTSTGMKHFRACCNPESVYAYRIKGADADA